MTDKTGHMDWPGAGPFSVQLYVDGIPIPYYTHPNPVTGRVELIQINPHGTKDELITDFTDVTAARLWVVTDPALND